MTELFDAGESLLLAEAVLPCIYLPMISWLEAVNGGDGVVVAERYTFGVE